VIDEHLESVRAERCDPGSPERLLTGLSLLTFSVAYLAWFAASALLVPVWIAVLQRGRETADEAWASGDGL
jgi:hypothetical protein